MIDRDLMTVIGRRVLATIRADQPAADFRWERRAEYVRVGELRVDWWLVSMRTERLW